MPVPLRIDTERLCLRRWSSADAGSLLPVLQANLEHLLPWIPHRVAQVAPPAEVARRLAGFAADFDAGCEWRYGVFSPDEQHVYGEVSLFPRAAPGRVSFECADHLEIGYWLRADVTGLGYATEAARALLALAATLPGMSRVEIRCDARNERSAAVPRRLGFRLADTPPDTGGAPDAAAAEQLIWYYELARPAG